MIKITACEIFRPYIKMLNICEKIDYLEIESHNYPHRLSQMIQKKIDESQNYSKILLIYGLCGNAILNIKARDVPVYVVKVHDCLSILLGSQDKFMKLFQDRLSAGWSCYSLETKPLLSFDQYDKEEQEYLKKIFNSPRNIYISFQMENEKKYEKNYKEVIQGDLSFLKDIVYMNSQELLEIKKDDRIIYDEREILKKEKKDG